MESVAHTAIAPARAESQAATTPWHLIAMVAGSLSIVLGTLWDISWHVSIGRDTFWSPPHAAVYLGGLLAGLSSGVLALKATFAGSEAERAVTVRFWGFRAPLGAWMAIWGSFAMLVSAPYDNWWHNAYGLDIGAFTPPHTLLLGGMIAIEFGVMFLALSYQNRASAGEMTRLGLAHLLTAGIVVATLIPVHIIQPNRRHSALFYEVLCAYLPFLIVSAARASRMRWAATITSAFYMLIVLFMVWVLPLFPAHPKLGPINMPITHMASLPFPLLLVFPALAIDFFLQRREGKRAGWPDAAMIGVTFAVIFFVIHWYFAIFQLSPGARNWFFAGDRFWSFATRPDPIWFQFWATKTDPMRAISLVFAVVWAILSTRLGLFWGQWMSKVQR
jgi:hypothetical protein